MKRTTHRIAALAAVGTIALAGCGSGNDSGAQDAGPSATTQADEGASSATSASGEGDSEARSDSEAASSADSDSSSDSDADPAGTHIARTAGLTITVKDIDSASSKVRSAATKAGGYISSEETHIADEDEDSVSGTSDSRAELVITVPVDQLESTISTLSKVGTVTERTSDATDLSQQYTDTEARVRSMKRSIKRLRTLIDEADDLEQIVDLESELATREADLESKVSQQKSLEKRTTTAPITVDLAEPGSAPDEPEEETGFLSGLDQGWDGFTSTMAVAATVLGAVTPFALTALVIVGPIAWWLRRRRAARPAASVEAPETTTPEETSTS
ncbi:MAG: DUF4349 domain-containing protein [Janibacter sp.]